jgi:hypothetical protein
MLYQTREKISIIIVFEMLPKYQISLFDITFKLLYFEITLTNTLILMPNSQFQTNSYANNYLIN